MMSISKVDVDVYYIPIKYNSFRFQASARVESCQAHEQKALVLLYSIA